MKLACICIGLIYMMLVPAIVALSLDLRSVGLRQLDNLRRSQESYLASATLNIAQSAHSPGALGTARQQIRDYMIRFDINSPGLDTESVADPNQLLNLVKAFQGNAMEQYLNKRFIADNDLIRRSLRNTMGTVLYSCFFLYLSRFWVESDSERM
ncbi:MAG: hypothetical protein VKI83_06845 [Synechococcaceae cyanobacterium]|nr:hypothetical protein [Synechococcaceae cyanobacterium]